MTSRLGHIADPVIAVDVRGSVPFVTLDVVAPHKGALLPDVDLPLRVPDSVGMVTFRPGDVLFGKLRPYLGKSWVADREGACSSEFIVMRPRPNVTGRWFGYLVQSRLFVDWAIASSVGVKMPRTSWEKLRSLELAVPNISLQDATASYLDAVSLLVNDSVHRRRRQSDLLRDGAKAQLTSLLGRHGMDVSGLGRHDLIRTVPGGWRVMPLNRVLFQMTNGYVGPTRDILRDSGIPYVQSVNVKDGAIDLGRRPYYVDESWHQEHARTALREGDVLVVQTGDVGQCAIVGAELGAANCHALLILRADSRVVTPPYLYWYLASNLGYQLMVSRATGALHPHLEAGELTSMPVVVPPIAQQELIVAELAERAQHAKDTGRRLESHTELLLERRQALITAAVTGQIEIPGLAA